MNREERTKKLDKIIEIIEKDLKNPYETWMPYDTYLKIIITLELHEIMLNLIEIQNKN